ncbi:response regulator transcription factor [Streptomyces canus]|uniref:response regulator transcription factor n=1 Tax=Streptomyces canus TaxID=58343 RepID=UPI00380BCC83
MAEALAHRAHDTVVVSRQAVRQLLHLAGTDAPASSTPSLTEREGETLEFMAAGMSNRQIARDMGITEHGVKRHVAHIFAKLNCRNRTTAVAVALRLGLVPHQPPEQGASAHGSPWAPHPSVELPAGAGPPPRRAGPGRLCRLCRPPSDRRSGHGGEESVREAPTSAAPRTRRPRTTRPAPGTPTQVGRPG